MSASTPVLPEAIHPSLWRGAQLARGMGRTLDTGYAALSAELPGGGWPLGALVDLLTAKEGIGEFRLLAPALAQLKRPIVLVNPTYVPNSLGLSHVGIPVDKVLLINPASTADALWSAEQVLRAGTCGGLIYWAKHMKASALRRLHLAAQSSETLFVMVRPLDTAQDASSAVLRLALRPAENGITVDIVKRRGPALDSPISLELNPSPILLSRHGRVRRPLAPVHTPRTRDENIHA